MFTTVITDHSYLLELISTDCFFTLRHLQQKDGHSGVLNQIDKDLCEGKFAKFQKSVVG